MPMLGWLHRYVTLTSSRGFKPTDVPDQFKLRIWVGNRPDLAKVDARAVSEIEKFRQAEGAAYSGYQITKRKYIWIPSAYEYTVQFAK